jgi:predicted nucleic acid-binding protein
MEWLNQLQGQTIGLDTAPLVYFMEKNPNYVDKVRPFFTALAKGDFKVVTSTVTLLEVLVKPLREGKTELAQTFRDILLNNDYLTIIPVSPAIAEKAAKLRAAYNLKTPDAIQIATAIQAKATAFITNDAKLSVVQNLRILVLNNLP